MVRKTHVGSLTYNLDRLMLNTAATLIRDFQTNLNDPLFCSSHLSGLLLSDIATVRGLDSTLDFASSDAYKFKAQYQVESILKRYRFSNDTYSDQELEKLTIRKFIETQDRLATVDLNTLSLQTTKVLDRAARYVARLLGPYSDEEHRNLCRFGKKASVGIPARKACEAERWETPISGSQQQIAWFDAEMRQNWRTQDYLGYQKDSDPLKEGSIYCATSYLKLVLVPKTFKSLRVIMPNTTIGSYMSYGIGDMIRIRLLRKGYDIRRLQVKHRRLARRASVVNNYVTADLSSASDSISDALVERLLPDDWFKILSQSRIADVLLPDGTIMHSLTHCTMGIGYTFPLQTLLFLALLKAIEKTFFSKSRPDLISVYGDDMIYHNRLHTWVLEVFGEIGFVINVDKTFSDGFFRESCGGDYFHGMDVRPFQPRNGQASVGKKAYEAILYKYINGLLMRWTEYEISSTLKFLSSELLAVVDGAKIVPADFPDDSGIKCASLNNLYKFLEIVSYVKPKSIGHGLFRFLYLRFKPEVRKENRHEPYYWVALRGDNQTIPLDSWKSSARPHFANTGRLIDKVTGVASVGVPQLLDMRVEQVSTFRSKISGRRFCRVQTGVVIPHTGRYMRQSGTSCFEDRS